MRKLLYLFFLVFALLIHHESVSSGIRTVATQQCFKRL